MKKLIFLLLPFLVPLKAAALELALEENRGESGTIGYVDIDKVFKEYSGTTGAREKFLSEIRKKEDAVNAKKTEIFTLRAEIAKLEQERELARTLPSLLATQRSVEAVVAEVAHQEAALSTGAAQAFNPAAQAQPSPAISTTAVQPPAAVLSSTAAAAQEIKLSTAAAHAAGTVTASTAAVQAGTPPPAAGAEQPLKPPAAEAAAASQVLTSTAAARQPAAAMPAGLPGMEGLGMPAMPKTPADHFKFSVSTSVPEIDAALAKKQDELKTKEEALRAFQKESERELLDYESHRSEIILGRIYTALKELAIKEEVSVIVDKRNILYGQNAVDLTDKLIKKLENGNI
jgi:Skp family chaperone for outer membrane proteins